jgi:hypothetical protein
MMSEDRTRVTLLSDPTAVPFRYEHGLVLFDGEGPAGAPLVVELDTCTAGNAVRHDLVSEQGWPVRGRAASRGLVSQGEAASRVAEVPELRLGGLEVRSLSALTDPLGGPAAPDIMLGEGFIRNLVIRLDYGQGVATFSSPESWSPPTSAPQRAVLRLDKTVGGVPCLDRQLRLNDEVEATTTLMDTGFNGAVLLSPALADRLGIRSGVDGVHEVSGGGYGGPATLLKGRLRSLGLGPFTITDIDVLRPPDGAGHGLFPDDYWAGVGNRVFERFTVTWAVPHSVVVLEAPAPAAGH